ncbi:MAG: MoxR family ATPase [Flavobacteriaceae bacterium]|nr:MoxR family ATPase [Flavobacteriaceae bacterium]MDG1779839.1 MoxR family ATPase [Flavobacteriales bacterium]MDG2246981.1 MoxR family ATPase [Flavobacteriales bacterium]
MEEQNKPSEENQDANNQPSANENPTSQPENTPVEEPTPGSSPFGTPPAQDISSLAGHSTISVPKADHVDASLVLETVTAIKAEIGKMVIGQQEMIEQLLAGILVGGHVLLEGYPGIAKTLTARMLAQTVSADFSRIQFTPDLMPTDITGTSVFNLKESEFSFRKGPIFSNIILIDEINRAPAKTQASLMEVMEEKQITYDGTSYKLDFPFFVIATQNPIEQEGTYSLPEAQLDRFVFRIRVPYPTLEEEQKILTLFESDFGKRQESDVQAIVTKAKLKDVRNIIEKVYIKKELIDYIAAIVNNTRNNGDLFLGASPRASLSILRTAKAVAAMRGRGFVTPDDIRYVCYPVLNHRVILSHEREMEGTTVEDVIKDILENIDVPR